MASSSGAPLPPPQTPGSSSRARSLLVSEIEEANKRPIAADELLPPYIAAQPALVSVICLACVKHWGHVDREGDPDKLHNECDGTLHKNCSRCTDKSRKSKCEKVPPRWRRAANVALALKSVYEKSSGDTKKKVGKDLQGYCASFAKAYDHYAHLSEAARAKLEGCVDSAEYHHNLDRWRNGRLAGVGECIPTNEVVDTSVEAKFWRDTSEENKRKYFLGTWRAVYPN